MTARYIVRVDQAPHPDAEPCSSWARWVCSCGRRSKLFGFRGHAESAGNSLAAALNPRVKAVA